MNWRLLLRKPRKTVAAYMESRTTPPTGSALGTPRQELASSYAVSRRASAPFALLRNTRKTVAAHIVFVTGISAAADIKAPPWETPRLVIGRDLFRENCAVCHDIDKDQRHSRKFGPSLNHLFKNPTLPLSHGKPSRQYVAIRIKFGGMLMPAFGKKLTDAQTDILLDYLASK